MFIDTWRFFLVTLKVAEQQRRQRRHHSGLISKVQQKELNILAAVSTVLPPVSNPDFGPHLMGRRIETERTVGGYHRGDRLSH